MTAHEDARALAVAHQTPGECDYCDDRYARMRAAFARELAADYRAARAALDDCRCDDVATCRTGCYTCREHGDRRAS